MDYIGHRSRANELRRGQEPAAQPASPQQPAPQPPVAAPPRAHRAKAEKPTGSNKKKIAAAVVAVLVIVGVVAWLLLKPVGGGVGSTIDTSKNQAVFFTNGQVYFGKLKVVDNEYLSLSNVYYLQTQADGEEGSENPQNSAASVDDVQLIKLGGELHGPEDEMIISKDQVLFYENLKDDGKVSQSIKQYKDNN